MPAVWRWGVGAVSVTLLVAAATLLINGETPAEMPPAPAPAATGDLPEPPQASEATREEKRFRRYDKDRNASVSRDEYLASRRKSYDKLDVNGDGVLSFDEYAVKQNVRFDAADADGSGELAAAEFATTRTVRKEPPKPDCKPA
jgi:hypothetical protein